MKEKNEIRDNRGKDRFFIDNKFYDTYAGGVGPNATAVYLALCRYSDNKSQKSFPSLKTIGDKLGISKPTVIGAIEILEFFKIIKKQRVGKRCTNRYTLLSVGSWRKDWEVMSTEFTSGEVNLVHFKGKPRLLHWLTQFTSNSKKTHSKKTQLTNAETSSARGIIKKEEKYNGQEEIIRLIEDKKRHVAIIGLYLKAKGINPENKEMMSSLISRNSRAANLLVGYPVKQIMETLKGLRTQSKFKWTLETVGKYIDDGLETLGEKGVQEPIRIVGNLKFYKPEEIEKAFNDGLIVPDAQGNPVLTEKGRGWQNE